MNDGSLSTVVSQAPVICGEHGLAPVCPAAAARGPRRLVPLPRLLHTCAARRETGLLTIDQASSVRTVLFASGAVVWAESSEPRHRFSAWLVANRIVNEAAVARATHLVTNGVCRFGEALVRTDAIGAAGLGRAAERFIVEVVVSAFAWRDGTYAFSPSRATRTPIEPPVFVSEPVPVDAILVEAYRRMSDLSLATLWLGDLGASRTLAADPFPVVVALGLTERHAALLTWLVSGSFSVAEAVESGRLDAYETIRVLGLLDAVGVVVPV